MNFHVPPTITVVQGSIQVLVKDLERLNLKKIKNTRMLEL